jgi:hypothetical protein
MDKGLIWSTGGHRTKAAGHHRSQCLTIAKALLRAAEPTTEASSITVISIMGLPAL